MKIVPGATVRVKTIVSNYRTLVNNYFETDRWILEEACKEWANSQ